MRACIQVISAQQLPLPKDAHGREIIDKSALDPYVEVSLHLPDWGLYSSPPTSGASPLHVSYRTSGVKNNGFNPVWEEALSLPFEVVGDMRELVFVRFAVRQDGDDEREALAVHCVSLACLREGTNIGIWPCRSFIAEATFDLQGSATCLCMMRKSLSTSSRRFSCKLISETPRLDPLSSHHFPNFSGTFERHLFHGNFIYCACGVAIYVSQRHAPSNTLCISHAIFFTQYTIP